MSDQENSPTEPRRSARERKVVNRFTGGKSSCWLAELFGLTGTLFSNQASSKKRRRDDGDETEKDQMLESDSDVADEDDEPDYVAPKLPPRIGPTKRTTSGTKATTRRKKRVASDGEPDANHGARLAKDAKISDDNALFSRSLYFIILFEYIYFIIDLILSPNTALQDTVDNFLESLEKEQEKALADLINCVLRSCGCNSSVDENQVMDIDGIVDNLDDFSEGFKTV